jgi:hypothetical protein
MNVKFEDNELLRHALALRDLGFICVPLGAAGRHLDLPRMGYEPVHLKNRTKSLKELAFTAIAFHLCQHSPDAATIRRWFDGEPSNLGILSGYRDLVILDFDREDCFERWQRRFGHLVRSTPVAKASRGYHVYLRCRQPMSSSSMHFGLRRAGHVKALGGYITAPPSRRGNGTRYQWLEGQSPYVVQPQSIESLGSVSLGAVSPLKHHYDRLLKRGTFIDDLGTSAAA